MDSVFGDSIFRVTDVALPWNLLAAFLFARYVNSLVDR